MIVCPCPISFDILAARSRFSSMFGATPLHFASHAGHTEVVTALLSKGGNPSTLNMYGSSPLHYAIEKAHADVVAALLEHEDSNVNLPNMYGYSPLHLAASHGSVTITELLLAKGANQKIKNSVRSIIMISRVADLRSHVLSMCVAYVQFGYTPAQLADSEGNEGVALLLEHGASEETSAGWGLLCL